MQKKFLNGLQQNVEVLRAYFNQSIDFYTKPISICGFSCCICMFEGLSSIERLWIMMLDILSKPEITPKNPEELFEFIMERTAIPMESKCAVGFEDARMRLTSGASLILIDGCTKGVVISTQSMQYRSVQEPSGEGNVRGAREGFTEPLRVNISLVRRLIRTGDLTIETMIVGARTKTEIAVLYHKTLTPAPLLKTVKERLEKIQIPFVFDSGYLAGFIQKSGFSFFQSVGYTERPDTAAAKICEGKIIVLVNGSPFAMVVPYFFNENFQSMDDYAEKAYFASFVRLLKYTAFIIAVLLPGTFVSIANFTPELLPPQLLYKIAAAEQATPLPLFLEALFVNFLLEIVREAGLRMPKPIGHSVSLVAALIVGDAAVNAGLLGTPVVIVAALTAISSFVVPSLYEPVTVLRILFILAGGLFGPVGIIALLFCALSSACNLQAFGLPFTAPIAPAAKSFLTDGLLRRSWSKLSQSNFSLKDLKRGAPHDKK